MFFQIYNKKRWIHAVNRSWLARIIWTPLLVRTVIRSPGTIFYHRRNKFSITFSKRINIELYYFKYCLIVIDMPYDHDLWSIKCTSNEKYLFKKASNYYFVSGVRNSSTIRVQKVVLRFGWTPKWVSLKPSYRCRSFTAFSTYYPALVVYILFYLYRVHWAF